MSTLASDNFNRANAGTLGANWTEANQALGQGFSIVSNQAVATIGPSNDSDQIYNAVTWPNDQWSQADLTGVGQNGPADGEGAGVEVRTSNPGASHASMYRVTIGTVDQVQLQKFIGNTYTDLGDANPTYVTGGTMYIEVQGTTIKVIYQGSTIFTVTDSAVTSGSAGIGYSTAMTSVIIDNWSGGDFSGGSAPTLPLPPMKWNNKWRIAQVWAALRKMLHMPVRELAW